MATAKGGELVKAYLAGLATKLAGQPRVRAGFLRGATYPDGTSVPMVAATNEYGVPSHNQPPRPFFRIMVEAHRKEWPKEIAEDLKFTNFDAAKALDLMGQRLKAEIQDSINELMSPPLAPATIKRKGFAKPLIDTAHMSNSVEYEVKGT